MRLAAPAAVAAARPVPLAPPAPLSSSPRCVSSGWLHGLSVAVQSWARPLCCAVLCCAELCRRQQLAQRHPPLLSVAVLLLTVQLTIQALGAVVPAPDRMHQCLSTQCCFELWDVRTDPNGCRNWQPGSGGCQFVDSKYQDACW